MQCRRIRLRDFRNVEEAEVHFSPGVNLLHGDNAQGKTNLLEALYYTALGKTFRTGHDEELIRFGAESAMIENCFSPAETVGQAGQADSTLLFRLLRGRGGRAVDRNGVRVRSMSEVVGGFRVVLFCPAHLSVVQGSPEDRRDFLNVAISQLRPVYVRALKLFQPGFAGAQRAAPAGAGRGRQAGSDCRAVVRAACLPPVRRSRRSAPGIFCVRIPSCATASRT